MAFIAKTDLTKYILLDELDEITRQDETVIDQAMAAAEAEMRTYLYDSYDVDTIFGKSGSARNQLLVNLCSDIAIYLIVAGVQAGQDLADRLARYKRAIAWLKAAQKTEMYSDLERREEPKQQHFAISSHAKRNNYF